VTLFGRPGELVRPYLIATREKVPFSSQIAAWLLERIYDLLMVLLIFGYSLAHLPSERSYLGPALEWTVRMGGYVAAFIGAACIIILVAASQFSEGTRRRLTDALRFLPPHLHSKADDMVRAFTTGISCTRNASQASLLMAWSIAEWAIIIVSTRCLFRSFPMTATLGWIDVMIFIGFVAFGAVVQIPGIGGGLQVAAAVVLSKLFGLDLEAATGVAILFWLLGFVLIVPIGLALMVAEGVKLKSLREISETELDEQPTAP
jgi:glycosyltransferase 2 family protein